MSGNMSNSMHTGCSGCKWYLGDGCCRINAEGECREGGGFELFEATEPARCEYCQCGDDGKYAMIEFVSPKDERRRAMMSFCDGEIIVEISAPGAEDPGRLASKIRFCPMCGRRVEEGTV